MLFAVCVLVAFVLWNTVTGRFVLLAGFVALLAFALCPPVVAWVIVAVAMIGLGAGAAEEMRAMRQWDEDSEMIRRAQVRRARRYLDR